MTQLDQHEASVSAETLALLRRLRVQYRDRPVVYRDLVRLSALAMSSSAGATELACENPARPSLPLSTQQAADLTGFKPVTIRRACAEKRLPAVKDGRDWRIARDDLNRWMVTRAA
ncbi:helix-turn-helix domain-containing protein [Nonomuraea sp. NPDC049714]|uniref:helix-turn-helix domain-containing protein n=1 Tax=Nonomuraea sp. NPDC049714 TaxID=3364357 RepID=UPI00379E1AA9